MGLFSFLTGKTKKTNLTPAEDYPSQESLYFTNPSATSRGYNLRDFAAKRIRGENLGFGDDFVNRQSSPGIEQIDANFKNRTMPTLSSEASKRGLARSSIIQDQIRQADLQRNRDVDSMVAEFQKLNEMQKKTDQQNAVQLASGLQDQERSILADRAAASERQVGRNIAGDQYQDASKARAGGNIMSAIGTLVGGPVGGSISSFGGGGGVGQMGSISTADLLKALYGQGGSSGVQTQI